LIITYKHVCFCRPKGEGAKKKGFPELKGPITSLPELIAVCDGKYESLYAMLGDEMDRIHLDQV